MAREEQWITTEELSKREGVSEKTILRYARAQLITSRRKGLGKVRGALEFPAGLAHEQITRMRQTHGIAVPGSAPAASPTLVELTQQIRDMNVRLDRLTTEIRSALSNHPESAGAR